MNEWRGFIFLSTAKLLFYPLNVLALFLLLRGHDLPGGGFIAGIVTAISVIMLNLAMGTEELHRIIRVDMARIAFAGLIISAAASSAPLVQGRPFMDHYHWRIEIPFIGPWNTGTAFLFDVGVMLVVAGVTCKTILVLGKTTEGLRILTDKEKSRYAASIEEPIESGRKHAD